MSTTAIPTEDSARQAVTTFLATQGVFAHAGDYERWAKRTGAPRLSAVRRLLGGTWASARIAAMGLEQHHVAA